MTGVQDLWREILAEISSDPRGFVVEVVQAALLIGLVIWIGRGTVRRRLAERLARVEADLAQASTAEQDSARLRDEARTVADGVDRAARALEQSALEQAERERDETVARTESEAQGRIAEARRTIAVEQERIQRDAADRLLHLTTECARRYIDEMLSEPEQRALTQQAIRESLAELEAGEPK